MAPFEHNLRCQICGKPLPKPVSVDLLGLGAPETNSASHWRESPMKTDKLLLCVFGLVPLFSVAVAGVADAPKLSFKFTKANVPGASQTYVAEINNEGVMVGQYRDSSGVYHGYILKGNNLVTLDHPNGTNTSVSGINFNGAIAVVGYYTNSSGNSVAFRYKPDTKQFADIQPPEGAASLYTGGINDQGWIVGGYVDASGVNHGFLLRGKKYTTLDVPDATATYAYGINNKGNITLTWVDSKDAYEGALYNYSAKTYTTIDVPALSVPKPPS